MEDKGESKFRNVMERYWYALFIIAVALAVISRQVGKSFVSTTHE